jgi:medium-chain acyl-[acyl-carrier-protein] hydrolase
MASPWIIIPRPLPQRKLALICLAHAGAGASTYYSWAPKLQSFGIELRAVQYPGREDRWKHPALTSVAQMVGALLAEWPLLSDGAPCAIFGHSMGALLAHELMLALAARGVPRRPQRLFLSGRTPPLTPPKHPPIHHLPDAEFIQAIAERFRILPPEILESPEMLELVTPILRADIKMVEIHPRRDPPPMDTPLSVFWGTKDAWTTEPEMAGWGRYTTGDFKMHAIEGDHFFHKDAGDEVIRHIVADM